MLSRLKVTGFKSLAEVSLELGSVNVFVGANGSGKSNILEALGVLSSALSGRVDDSSLKARGVRPGVPALYKSSFKAANRPKHIRFEAYGKNVEYSVSLYNPIVDPSTAWRFKHEKANATGLQRPIGRSPASYKHLNEFAGVLALEMLNIDPTSAIGLFVEALREYAIFSPDTQTLRGLEPDTQAREPVGLSGGRLPEAVMEVMRDPDNAPALRTALGNVEWVKSYGTRNSSDLPISASVSQPKRALRFVDRFMSDNRNVLSGYDASEGVLYVLFCAILALHRKSPRIFAIDNFDQALNPRLARTMTTHFCNWILDSERQVLLTTHNPLVLDGLPLLDDKVRLFAVDRSLTGRTVVTRVEVTSRMIRASQAGTPLSVQWVTGNFGGVPSNV